MIDLPDQRTDRRTDGRTDGQTDTVAYRDARTHLKTREGPTDGRTDGPTDKASYRDADESKKTIFDCHLYHTYKCTFEIVKIFISLIHWRRARAFRAFTVKAHFVVQSGSVVHWRQKNREKKSKKRKKIKKKEGKIEKIRKRSEKIAEI